VIINILSVEKVIIIAEFSSGQECLRLPLPFLQPAEPMTSRHIFLECEVFQRAEDIAEDADGFQEETEEEPGEEGAIQGYQKDPAVQHHIEG